MATVHGSKIITPFMPSLSHISAVNVALQLYKASEFPFLQAAYDNLQKGTHMTLLVQRYGHNWSPMWKEIKRARDMLLLIPGHLIKEVMKAVVGLHLGVVTWFRDHPDILSFYDPKPFISWRTDGAVDRTRTAQQLILNENIDVRKRFELACMYCLEDIVKRLWAVIEASGEAEIVYTTTDKPVVWFWINFIYGGCRGDWRKYAATYIAASPRCIKDFRCSSLFPTLSPKLRKKASRYLYLTSPDHFLQCMFSTTVKEEMDMLKDFPLVLLDAYTEWPQRILLLETAKKALELIDETTFIEFLKLFIQTKLYWKDFDFYEQFNSFWNMNCIPFREAAKENPKIKDRISSCFNEMRPNRSSQKIKRRYSRI